MPIYVLHCSACDVTSESLILPREPIECPKCKTREVNKVPAVTSPHVWRGSSDGAEPKGKSGKP